MSVKPVVVKGTRSRKPNRSKADLKKAGILHFKDLSDIIKVFIWEQL